MTPYQHHYPYFLDLPRFNNDLAHFHLQARLKEITEKEQVLMIGKIDKTNEEETLNGLIEFGHGHFLMIRDLYLYAWYKQDGGFVMQQYDLQSPEAFNEKLEEFVDVHHLEVGTHQHVTDLTYDRMVTFIRKENLQKKEAWHEAYVIVLLHQQHITIIPFNSFNETGGDPLYQWPALACWDWVNGKLHGYGMRMGSFTVDLHAQ